jgi:large subunit ribosomal protein L3
MTLYDEWGVAHPVTALHFDNVQALGAHRITNTVTGFQRIVQEVGSGVKSPRTTRRHLQLYYRRCKVAPKLRTVGSVVKDIIPPGTWIRAGHFIPGQYVEIRGKSKGKGFQGGMKRHGFKGFPASHGTSLTHRAIGSVGCRRDGKVWRGKKMPGRMGNKNTTVKKLYVMKVDNAADVLYVRGSIPGPRKGFLRVKDSKHNPIFEKTPPPYPTLLPTPGMTLPREVVAKSPHTKDPLYTVEGEVKK